MADRGIGVDELDDAVGAFGRSPSNPIPVRGVLGELTYLSRLVTEAGEHVVFHRLGSAGGTNKLVDVYEVMALDGLSWDILFFDMYHPRRSRKAPVGYSIRDDARPIEFLLGINGRLSSFPSGVYNAAADAANDHLGFPLPPLPVGDKIFRLSSNRPADHVMRLQQLAIQAWRLHIPRLAIVLPGGVQRQSEAMYLLRGYVAAAPSVDKTVLQTLPRWVADGSVLLESLDQRCAAGTFEPLLPVRGDIRNSFEGIAERAEGRQREIAAFLWGLQLARFDTSSMDSGSLASLEKLMEWIARLEILFRADRRTDADYNHAHARLDQVDKVTETLLIDVEQAAAMLTYKSPYVILPKEDVEGPRLITEERASSLMQLEANYERSAQVAAATATPAVPEQEAWAEELQRLMLAIERQWPHAPANSESLTLEQLRRQAAEGDTAAISEWIKLLLGLWQGEAQEAWMVRKKEIVGMREFRGLLELLFPSS